MSYLSAILGGLSLGLFMAISVGPTLFAVIKYSLNHSYKTGLAFVLGVSISDIMYVSLANLAAPLLHAIYKYEKYISIIGGLILIVIGLIGLLSKYKPIRYNSDAKIIKGNHYLKILASGFLINTANPGVILSWITAVSIVASKTANLSPLESSLHRIAFFGSCLGLVLGIDFLKVFLAGSIRKKLTLRKVMYLQKTSAACLFFIGLGLILFTLWSIYNKSPLPQ